MALTITHLKISTVPDGPDPSIIQPSDWNATHSLSGSIGVAEGGTGLASYTVGDLLVASGATTLAKIAAVAAGAVLVSNGAGAAPIWSTTPTFVGTNITSIPAANLTGTIASAVQDLITRLGTVVSGAWHGALVGVLYGGTGADLSATGGTKQFLKQTSAGGAISVGTAAITDMSDAATWPGSTAITTTGTVTTGTWSGLFGAISGANLTNLTAANLSGTIANAVQDTITRTGSISSGTWGGLFAVVSGANLTNLTAANLSGTILAVNFPALIGDVTTVGGSLSTAIGAGKITNTMLAGLIDLATKVTGILAPSQGGTGNAFVSIAGPAASIKTFNLPNASATILTDAAAVSAVQGGTGFQSYTVGDTLYASSTTTIGALADVSAGSYLRSGGVATAPLWSTLKLPNAAVVGDLLVATSTNTMGVLSGVATGAVLVSGGVGALPVWSTTPTISSFFNANHDHSNTAGGGPFPIDNLSDVVITSPVLDQVLRWNGSTWVNGAGSTSSAGPGLSLFDCTPAVITAGVNSAISVLTMATSPVTTTEQTIAGTAASNTVLFAGWVTNGAMGRASLSGGVWTFATYCGVDTVAAGRVTTLTRQIYDVLPFLTGTVTITGTGTSRTATASGGTPFAVGKAVGSSTNTTASYLQTPNGIFQITSVGSDTVCTITCLGTYTNETAVAGTVWLKLFGYTSVAITAISTAYTLTSETVTQAAFTVSLTSRIGELDFVTSNNTTTLTITYNGTLRNTYVQTPLTTLHNFLEGLQGGVDNEYYHLTAAEHAAVSGGVWAGTPIAVTAGGTGLATLTTAYGIIAAGTTATGSLQNVGVGSAGQVLTSNGAGALATWQASGASDAIIAAHLAMRA